jgi:hypothetical protein
MLNGRLTAVLVPMLCCLMMALLINIQPSYAAKKSTSSTMTPSELQSQVMSFADRFIARVDGTTIDYIHIKGYAKTPRDRFAVNARRLVASSAAVSIAAGPNPETALLDMVTLVSLLRLTTEDVWVGKKLVPHSQILLKAYVELEKDIWAIANSVLSKEQSKELQSLIYEWHKENINTTVSVSSIRFGDFAKKRRQSTLEGKVKGFLKSTNAQIEQTRVLAERTVFMAERQPNLIRWQIEQIFFDLAMEPEFKVLLDTSRDIALAGKSIAKTAEEMPAIITKERKETITQAISEISKERQAFINQTSENILDKAFYLGIALIFMLLIGAIAARLVYRYLEIRLFEKR